MAFMNVTVSGITEVNFNPDGKHPFFYNETPYAWIWNKSSSTIYASDLASCVPGEDGTAQIGAGEMVLMIVSARNKLYFNGDGDITISTDDVSECPWSGGSGSGGGGSSGGDYPPLTNKPKINGFTLVGDKSFDDLGLKAITRTQIDALFN